MPPNTNGSRPAVVMALPFTASAHEHVENAQTVTVVQTAAVQNLNPIDVPAYGYLRHLVIEVVGAGGTGGTMSADGPWNIIQSVSLQDVNGANIVGPLDGYALYLANIVGGYVFNNNPSNIPSFVGSAPNPVFQIRVPVEISARDGFGALANQNTAANFKLSLSINSTAAVYSAAPSPLPTYTIRVWLEAWTVPAPANSRGDTQAQVPPLLGTGQFWSQMTRTTLSGNNTVLLTRTGNLIRNLVLVGRDVSGVRSDAVLMDPLQFNWDGNQIHNASLRYFKNYLFERMSGAFTYPTGVVALPFSHGLTGRMGNESPDLWLPSSQSSRLEFVGNTTAAGSIQVITNDIAPIEPNQAERYQVPNDTGRLASPAMAVATA
jgi:hypothetical protein